MGLDEEADENEEEEEEEDDDDDDDEGNEDAPEDEISGDEKEGEEEEPIPVKKAIAKKTKVTKAEDDQKMLASGLMSRKTRKMYTNIKRAEGKKSSNVEELKRKRKLSEEKKGSETKRAKKA